ncbi:MAG: hypothetical protein U0Z53_26875 [Blastocatellia bacterium]
MTDEELNRKFDRIENQIEALTESLDRLEEAQLADRQRFDEAQAKADARIARLERVVTLIVRAGDRERKSLRESIRALSEAQAGTERNLALMVEHFDRKTDTQADWHNQTAERIAALTDVQQRSEARFEVLAESQTAMQQAMAEMAESNRRRDDALAEMAQAVKTAHRRIDSLESNGKVQG